MPSSGVIASPVNPAISRCTGRGVPASALLATLTVEELIALFRKYGEEPFAGRIARAIEQRR